MSVKLDETHDPAVTSWLTCANDANSDFPIQNLPFGVFRKRGSDAAARVGVAIGSYVLDVAAIGAGRVFEGAAAAAAAACNAPSVNGLMELGRSHWSALRLGLSRLLRSASPMRHRVPPEALVRIDDAELFLPAFIGDYSDFFASIHHATNAGRLFRPDNPLLPNYKHVPIAYHGRASSIVVSGTPVIRPRGQTRLPDEAGPSFGASQRLDYELELGVFIGSGNALGKPISLADAQDHVFGLCLVNDWSARDIQSWEYQPLGPFLGKSFATSISPWVVTLDALMPFRRSAYARPPGDPAPLPYLDNHADRASGGIDIALSVKLSSQTMRSQRIAPHTLAQTSSQYLYWTIFQMVAHHTVNGCNLRPGDLIATGTLSGPERTACGSLLEMSVNASHSFALPSGETRTFLEDGDEVLFHGRCSREGYRSIGFGECRGVVVPAN
ncbi:MAG: fumarylacetoacetase [Betaproteobacteria bacterium]|jgi:fumarylacetoacetase|nr:fumarylacetoacetase [Betaproteobacteria bacterium]MEA3157640.1 fumarylacetoacetase [Betaproteobacteria bacterium]